MLHDLRHTFACRRVEARYDAGADLAHAVSALSVYLGHAKVTDTYWYLTATPALMARAAGRFESFARPAGGEVRPRPAHANPRPSPRWSGTSSATGW